MRNEFYFYRNTNFKTRITNLKNEAYTVNKYFNFLLRPHPNPSPRERDALCKFYSEINFSYKHYRYSTTNYELRTKNTKQPLPFPSKQALFVNYERRLKSLYTTPVFLHSYNGIHRKVLIYLL